MADGANKDYKFGQKNNWRRAMWNEVLSRTSGRERVEPILYLAGPQDMDREIALSKGVHADSMIAIDRSRQNVDAIRELGASAINADAIDALMSWPSSRPVSAVLMDFCCGLDRHMASDLYVAMTRVPFRNAVWMVNFMRGRDSTSNTLRDALREMFPSPGAVTANGVKHDASKHRGAQFLMLRWLECFLSGERSLDRLRRVFAVGFERQKPWFWSYRSGNLVFDSAVFWPLSKGTDPLAYFQGQMGGTKAQFERIDRAFSDPKVARKIAATLAVRTMRMGAIQ